MRQRIASYHGSVARNGRKQRKNADIRPNVQKHIARGECPNPVECIGFAHQHPVRPNARHLAIAMELHNTFRRMHDRDPSKFLNDFDGHFHIGVARNRTNRAFKFLEKTAKCTVLQRYSFISSQSGLLRIGRDEHRRDG